MSHAVSFVQFDELWWLNMMICNANNAFTLSLWGPVISWLSLQWRHNERDGVSNHQPRHCLLNRLFRIKENIKAPRHWSFVVGIHRWPVNSPHKGPVTRSFDVFFDLRLTKQLSKQSRCLWFGKCGKCFHLMTSSCSKLVLSVTVLWIPNDALSVIQYMATTPSGYITWQCTVKYF